MTKRIWPESAVTVEDAINSLEQMRNLYDEGVMADSLDLAINAVKTLQWIPVNEQLPVEYENEINTYDDNMHVNGSIKRMESDICFVTVKGKDGNPCVYASYTVNGKFPDDVIAWMPFPDPYREGN